MMKSSRCLLFIFVLALFAVSCSKDDETTPASYYTGQNYFPDDTGIVRIYVVDSVAYDEFTNTVDTFRYYFREVIESHFLDNSGRKTQRIERYLYDSTAGNWIIWKVVSANLTATTAEVTEDNYRYLRLIFPPALNANWNGNVHNTLDAQTYKITAVHQPETTAWFQLDSTLTVVEADDFTLIRDRYAEERYSSGKGMYYRYHKDVETNPANLQIISGFIYTAHLVSFTEP
jgi:hypothetical protein